MIGSAQDVRDIKPISENLNDAKRLVPYIEEAEFSDVMDSLGAKCYKAFDSYTTGSLTYEGCGGSVTFTEAEVSIVLDGGYYDDDNGYCKGLKSAIAYLAYSRFVKNQSVNAAAFGMVVKNGQLSEQADVRMITMQANEAEKMGKSHLFSVFEFIKFKEGLVRGSKKRSSSKLKIIGD